MVCMPKILNPSMKGRKVKQPLPIIVRPPGFSFVMGLVDLDFHPYLKKCFGRGLKLRPKQLFQSGCPVMVSMSSLADGFFLHMCQKSPWLHLRNIKLGPLRLVNITQVTVNYICVTRSPWGKNVCACTAARCCEALLDHRPPPAAPHAGNSRKTWHEFPHAFTVFSQIIAQGNYFSQS